MIRLTYNPFILPHPSTLIVEDMLSAQIVSDLHIERFHPLIPNPKDLFDVTSDVIILAGDIGRVENWIQYAGFISKLSDLYKKIIIVPGNHEYYYTSFDKPQSIKLNGSSIMTMTQAEEKLRSLTTIFNNVVVLINDSLLIESVNSIEKPVLLFGSPYFSYIPDEYFKPLPIYKTVDNGRNAIPLTCADWNLIHFKCRNAFESAQTEAIRLGAHFTVITHYAPTFKRTLSDKYYLTTDPHVQQKNYYYCSNNDFYLTGSLILNWVYGHTSHNCDFYTSPTTRLVSNQLDLEGYDKTKTIDLVKRIELS